MNDPVGCRYVYTEFALESASIAMIKDRKNEHAWIQSSHTVTVHR